MGWSYGLLAVSLAVAAAVLSVALPHIGTPGRRSLFLRFAAVSGVLAVGSSAMYFMYGAGGGTLVLVPADVAMVLAPWLLLIAIQVIDGRRARLASAAVVVSAVVVGAATSVAEPPLALTVKILVLAVACGACAVTAARARVDPAGPMRVIAVATALFAASCIIRAVLGVAAGEEAEAYRVGFSFAPVTVLGAVVVLVVGVAVVRVGAGSREEVPTDRPSGAAAVVIGDWRLASTAYGPESMRELVAELRTAARDLDPDAVDLPRGAALVVPPATPGAVADAMPGPARGVGARDDGLAMPDAVAVVGRRLAEVYGWTPEQVLLLSNGAVRMPPDDGESRHDRDAERS